MRCAIGIDLGGTSTSGALVDQTGRIMATVKRPTPAAEGSATVLAMMQAMVAELLPQAPAPVLGIGLGITGLMDREAGISIVSPNFANWRNVAVVAPFRERFGLPVTMDNDVRVGALAELYFGAGRGFQSFLFTAIGTGIGAGIVLDGELYRGPYGTAGEFGHIPIGTGGARCGCGALGCLETLCSGPAIRRRTLQALETRSEPSQLRALPKAEISAQSLTEAARAGDGLALALWEEIGTDFGLGVAAYYNLFGPEAVVVGGGVSLAGDLLLEPARRTAVDRLMPGIRERVRLVPAALGDTAGVVGAAALVDGLVG